MATASTGTTSWAKASFCNDLRQNIVFIGQIENAEGWVLVERQLLLLLLVCLAHVLRITVHIHLGSTTTTAVMVLLPCLLCQR